MSTRGGRSGDWSRTLRLSADGSRATRPVGRSSSGIVGYSAGEWGPSSSIEAESRALRSATRYEGVGIGVFVVFVALVLIVEDRATLQEPHEVASRRLLIDHRPSPSVRSWLTSRARPGQSFLLGEFHI